MKTQIDLANAKRTAKTLALATAFVGALFVPEVFAQAGFAETDKKVCGFFDSISGLLNMASIAVVTIAVIFAGYQIAFAHKRISDVSPILIGGLLIGAASQIAKMLLGDGATECTAALVQASSLFYA
ncbi:type VI secretion protein [Stenotrophomonas chelatiphaga]|jgi:type IV secretion system protein VirB2|uniref:Type VI secretion protein n=1 Tax=Stenotrophomonas chelatiphaga TaxID=517011 RepID=A0A0R0CNZ1_9GAMM|nr:MULTISPECIES: TrbC/VirB2 family protein [Stenotrophomonas]MBJ7514918.1 TrbC/VirB2 family protein [Stenotrophomonas sp.]ROQ36854.1 type IV secretion system protein VirB2 [Stenotrophomonas maltophilia]KRG67591.1 type VI secretion protein [Stenotrophomonas chelatiphaga]MCS4229612.1 type IV secretion system protein VirB2 [Stenotrophomonas chelatiphaga]MDR6094660.1 type IV secretion system protein VirB2 [Stenotrophomonas sp. SORGH_AS_0321]